MSFDDFDDGFDDEVTPAVRPGDPAFDGEEEAEDRAEMVFDNVYDWFAKVFQDIVERSVVDSSEFRWCEQWHEHPEVLTRMTALWRSWEHLNTDADMGMSVWLRDHLDHHLAQILSLSGPFRHCKVTSTGTEHTVIEPLPWTLSAAQAIDGAQQLTRELEQEVA